MTGSSPTGTVTVSDGNGNSCSGTVAAGSCTMAFATAGNKSLTADYGGDANKNPASSSPFAHTVLNLTMTSITSTAPNPSAAGQSVTVSYSVTGASPTGTVTVSDGNGNSCMLTFDTAGNKSLTADYGGDANNSASSSGPFAHQVNAAASVTSITSTAPNPSAAGQSVTVSDGNGNSCNGTVAAGSCMLTFATAGNKSLTADYGGDANNSASQSSGFQLQVGPPQPSAGNAKPIPTLSEWAMILLSLLLGGFGMVHFRGIKN